MKKLKTREEFLNEGHSYDNEIEKARMMQGSASELVEWAARKVAESKPENFKEGVISPIQEAKESYKIMRLVNGRTKELIEGTIGEIMDQFSSAMDKLRDSGSGKQYKDDPKTIEELVKYLNAAQSYIDKGKSKITYEIQESVDEAAKDHRFKYVIGKDFKNHGVVDFVKGDKLYVEIDADGNTVPYSSNDVYILSDSNRDILMNGVMTGKITQSTNPKDFKKWLYNNTTIPLDESVNEGFSGKEIASVEAIKVAVEHWLGDYDNVEDFREMAKHSTHKDSKGKEKVIAKALSKLRNMNFDDGEKEPHMDLVKKKSKELSKHIAAELGQAWESEKVTEARKPITKKHWDKADDDQKEEWLLQAYSDPDDAIEHIEKDWEDLPPQASSNMYEALNFIIRPAKSGDPFAEYGKPFFITTKDADLVVKKMNDLGIRTFTNKDGDEYEVGLETYDPKSFGYPGKSGKLLGINQEVLQKALDVLDQRKDKITGFGWMSTNESVNENLMAGINDLAKKSKDIKSFKKAFYKTYSRGKQDMDAETDKWLEVIYNRAGGANANESVSEDDNWSDDVKTKWTPPAGLFTEPANKIADVLHKESDDLDQAMSRLQFYINRGGKLLDGKAKANLETAKKLLQQKYK